MMNRTTPELLAPAGSPEALDAALAAGADAVYLGGGHFNARMNARNFDAGELREAVAQAHHVGSRVYLTLNTLLWDRELPDALCAAYEAAVAGVDALIIADLGAAALIRRSLPGLPLHASTQLSGHNARVGEVLAPFGFSRFVIARETSLADLSAAVQNNPLEVEVFVHGALCVSHSGQCLFSSIVGGRSGNRGECAQPCRLPYKCERGVADRRPARPGRDRRPPVTEDGYPLSLKDLTLAAHVPALIEAGVASLKIEGRMKSPGYVSGVTAVWRRLLDEGRGATAEEMAFLSDLFSRDGFTDAYQTGDISSAMMGIRREADKERTAAAERDALAVRYPPHLPLSLSLSVRENRPVTLTARAPLYRQGSMDIHSSFDDPSDSAREGTDDMICVTVESDPPLVSEGQTVSEELVAKQFSRTGGTPYRLAELSLDVGAASDGKALFLPVSRLNALRRDAVEALDAARAAALPDPAKGYTPLTAADTRDFIQTETAELAASTCVSDETTARFRTPAQITLEAVSYFDRLYLPMGAPFPAHVPLTKRGYVCPPVVFDRDAEEAVGAVTTALVGGIRHFLVGNLGHLSFIEEALGRFPRAKGEIVVHGDFRLGVTNTPALARMLAAGLADVILSPELTLPRMRDIRRAIGREDAVSAIVYGRLPLMMLEKCAIREIWRDRDPAAVCREVCAADAAVLTDRMGKRFPILREDFPHGNGHRNVVYNSLPICMSDVPVELAQAEIARHHFIFTVESPAEVDAVITAHLRHRALSLETRRMVK